MQRVPGRQLAKPQRQHRIARLLSEQAVASQGQLVELLAAEGIVATQATVSRDLDDLGAAMGRVAMADHVRELAGL
jgi:transcriptional regulator of arginine metabolism